MLLVQTHCLMAQVWHLTLRVVVLVLRATKSERTRMAFEMMLNAMSSRETVLVLQSTVLAPLEMSSQEITSVLTQPECWISETQATGSL